MNRNMSMRSTAKIKHNSHYLYNFEHMMDYVGYIPQPTGIAIL